MTGQYPKRRETDYEAEARNARAEGLREERLALAVRIPFHVYRAMLPYITASGRLVVP